MFEAYFEAKALHPKTNKFVGVRSLKAYRGLPRNAGLPFLVYYIFVAVFGQVRAVCLDGFSDHCIFVSPYYYY